MRDLLVLIRPQHWLKNLLVFLPALVTFTLTADSLGALLLLFTGFSFLASSIYVVNDIFDAERDRNHPKKSNRPIAARKISIQVALCIHLLLAATAFGIAFASAPGVFPVFTAYYALNIAYSLGLKHIPIVDAFILALGFVLRISAGSHVLGVANSQWLLLCAFIGSLFMAFGKRRHELLLLSGKQATHRKASAEYTEMFMNQLLGITATITLVFYSLYTIDPATQSRFNGIDLLYSVPIVMFLLFRYLFLLYNRNTGGDPVDVITNDRPLLIAGVLLILTVFAARAGSLNVLGSIF
jgi:4-hydroxybenzoate polyprenyltransferase